MSRSIAATIHLFAGALVLSMVEATTGQDRFVDGPGKPEIVKVCSGCHDAEIVLAALKTPAEWSETLESMAQQGADATPDEWRLIERYIDTNFALIQINKAAADDLQRTMDVTSEVAAAIVARRRDNGAFKSIDEIKKVAGVDAAKVDARKNRFVF
jgi:competence protein ComEA